MQQRLSLHYSNYCVKLTAKLQSRCFCERLTLLIDVGHFNSP
jgi:hypothetical protein